MPPDNYPSTAPFASLTKYFSKLIKLKVITSKLLKQLLYPEYLNKMNLNLVKIRHHKTECFIMTKRPCRDSVINCDSSDSNNRSSSSSSTDDNSSDNNSSRSSNPFGYIRYYNPQTNTETSSNNKTKYESFIDYGEPVNNKIEMIQDEETNNKSNSILLVSTAKLHLLQKQLSENSEASSCLTPKPYLACEDLVNLDDNTKLDNTLHVPLSSLSIQDYHNNNIPLSNRQSCPTKLVGNKFNNSSLTTIYIPSWSNSDNNLTCQTKYSGNNDDEVDNNRSSSGTTTTTMSSSLELPVNTLPLPDGMVAELLYNFEPTTSTTSSIIIDKSDSYNNLIKPPTMFEKQKSSTSSTVNLNLDNIGFRKHSINSDKPRRRSSIQINRNDLINKQHKQQQQQNYRRCISSQFLQLKNRSPNNNTTTTTSNHHRISTTVPNSDCQCCFNDDYFQHHSPRSSDSGMAGSCTLNSPDLANTNDLLLTSNNCSMIIEQNRTSDHTNLRRFDSNNLLSSSGELDARDYESECPCTSPFGSTPRTSCQPSISSNILSGSNHYHHDDDDSFAPRIISTSSSSLLVQNTNLLDLYPPQTNINDNNYYWGSQLIPTSHSNNDDTTIISHDDDVDKCKYLPHKSKSMGCLLDNNNDLVVVENDNEMINDNNQQQPIYKSGLYAHWWLKAKIPASVVKGIYQDTRSSSTTPNTTSATTTTGKNY